MPLSRSFPIDSGFPNALDLRRLDAGLIAREGVFPDPTTIATAGIAYGNGGWNVGARAFVAALKRGSAPYALTYGVARVANDAAGTAWTIDPAPVSGSRIDLLWVRATDPGQGEATSGSDGPGGAARAVPVFGVTTGVPGTTPATPALPAGALLIATVTTPSGAASIAGSTIVQSYRFAQAIGGILYARTFAEFSAEPGVVGEEAVTLTSYQRYRHNGTSWEVAPYELRDVIEYTSSGTFLKANYPRLRALRVRCVGGGGGGGGVPATAAGESAAAAGGGGGGMAEVLITNIAGLAASVTVTRGAGGAGGVAGNNAGAAGDASSFGALCVGAGGGGGAGGANGSSGNANASGGGGGGVTTGDSGAFGSDGTNGYRFTNVAAQHGTGGASAMSGSRQANTGSSGGAGNNGRLYGGGGSGAWRSASQAAAAGGDGAPGIVIVEVYE